MANFIWDKINCTQHLSKQNLGLLNELIMVELPPWNKLTFRAFALSSERIEELWGVVGLYESAEEPCHWWKYGHIFNTILIFLITPKHNYLQAILTPRERRMPQKSRTKIHFWTGYTLSTQNQWIPIIALIYSQIYVKAKLLYKPITP